MKAELIRNPLQSDQREAIWVITGETLGQLARNSFPPDTLVQVFVNGQQIPDEQLDVVKVQPGDHVLFVPVLSGGDNTILRSIAFITLAVVSGGIVTGMTGLTSGFLYGLGTTAVILAGGMLINALMPVPQKSGKVPDYDSDRSQSYSWNPETTQRQGYVIPRYYGLSKICGNVIAAWTEPYWGETDEPKPVTGISKATPGVVTCKDHGFATGTAVKIAGVLGMTQVNDRMYKVTSTGTNTFTIGIDTTSYSTYSQGGLAIKALGTRQLLYCIVALGEGPIADISDVKLNDKPIETLQNVGLEFRSGINSPGSFEWFNRTITEHRVNVLASEASGMIAEAVTTGDYMDHCIVGVAFPYGIHNNLAAYSIGIRVKYRERGFGSWTTLFDGNCSGNNAEVYRIDLEFATTRGKQYEVQLEKTTADQSDTYGDDVYIESIKEVLDVNFIYPGLACVGVRALATDQLSGNIGFSCIGHGRVVPCYQDNSRDVAGITKASSAVLTVGSGHGFSTGDYALVTGVRGMTEINDRLVRVTATTSTTITVNINSTEFSTYRRGGIVRQFSLESSSNPAHIAFDVATQPLVTGGDGGKWDSDDLTAGDLVAWYKMNDNAANATVVETITGGANYDGQFQAGGSPSNTDLHDATGYRDGALSLDTSSSDRIVIPTTASNLDITGDMTIACHIYPSRLNNIILDNRFNFVAGTNLSCGYHLQTNDAGQVVFCTGNNSTALPANQRNIKSEKTVTLNQWNWIVVVKKGRKVTIYINGIWAGEGNLGVATTAYSGTYTARRIGNANDSDCWGGRYGFGSNQYADADIDNLKIWDIALTWEQIQVLSGNNSYEVVAFKGFAPSRIRLEDFAALAEYTEAPTYEPSLARYVLEITRQSQAVVSTHTEHGLSVGDSVSFGNNILMTSLNDGDIAPVVAVNSATEFIINLDTTGYGVFVYPPVLLCHFNGYDGEKSSIDSSLRDHVLFFSGEAHLNTAQKQLGESSLHLSGAAGTYVYTGDNADYNFGSGNFTLRFFIRWFVPVTTAAFLGQSDGAGNNKKWSVYFDNTAHAMKVEWQNPAGTSYTVSWSWTPTYDTWYWCFIRRTGSDWEFIVNGVAVGGTQTQAAAMPDSSGQLQIGADGEGNKRFIGCMDELAICKGWIESATVPLVEIAPSSGVVQRLVRRVDFNGMFDLESSMWDALLRICQIGRAMPYWAGNVLRLAIDKSSDPVQLFSSANIIAGSMEVEWIPLEDRASELEIHYNSEEDNYERTVNEYFDAGIDNPSSKVSVEMMGITSSYQAKRAAALRLAENRLLTMRVKYEADIDSIVCTIGDVVWVQGNFINWGKIGSGSDSYDPTGRLVSVDMSGADDVVTIDRDIAAGLPAGKTYELMVRDSADKIETRTIKSVSGRQITLDGSFATATPAKDSIWVIGEQNLVARKFRVQKVERTSDDRATITAIKYDEEVYAGEVVFAA